MADATPMDIDTPTKATNGNGASASAAQSSQASALTSAAASPSSSSASSSTPLANGKSTSAAAAPSSAAPRGKKRVLADSDDDSGADDDDDVPLQAATSRSRRKLSADDDDDEEDEEEQREDDADDDEGNGGYDENEGADDADDDADNGDEDDAASITSKGSNIASNLKKRAVTIAKRLTGRSDKKWDTLYHKGPRFPPSYEPLPKNVKLKYEGKPVPLPPESEEAAMFYAIKIETDYVKKPSNAAIFNKNFFDDWKKILAKHPPANGVKITDLSKCDFRDMYNHFKELRDAENERKKNMAPSARKKEIEEKKAAEASFRTCVVDGVEQKVGNFTVEPPGLFLGRGAHPKMGKIKKRIRPEDITINHTQNDPKHPPPSPPKGHRWHSIVSIKDKTWLASWIENVNKQNKYMYLDSSSLFKTNSDRDKFEKARKLDNHVRQLRSEYEQMLTSKSRSERELGTVVWLIDVWSLRVGNEKNAEEEAETYGACSLLKEHITCLPVLNPEIDPHWVKLSFLGKDSMKFEGQNVATPQIYKNLQLFSKGFKDIKGNTILKKGSDPLFMSVDPSRVNKFLTGHMAGLSAKVFRTYNASVTFQALLDRTDFWLAAQPDPDRRVLNPANLKLAYEAANYQVAVLCNHQRTLNQQQMEQAENRAASKRFAILYDRYKLRQLLLTGNTQAELKKAYKSHDFSKRWSEIFEEVPIKVEQVQEFEETQAKQRKEKLMKRFERDQLEEKYQAKLKKESSASPSPTKGSNGNGKKTNKKLVEDSEQDSERDDEDGKKRFLSKEQRDEQLKAIDERLKVLAKERKSGKAEEASGNIPGVCKKILNCVEKLKAVEAEAEAKMKTSDVALGTSKLNYIDPRITVAWLKKYDVRLQEEALKDPTSKLSKEMAKIKEEEEEAAAAAKKAASKKGGKGKKVKKEETEDEEEEEEDVKPNGRKRGRGAASAANGSPARKRAKAENGAAITTASGATNPNARTNLNAIGESDKMELGLKVLNLTHYFPNTMQKKFKWAATDDDGLDLRPGWQFVKDPWTKMRKPARKEGSKADNVDMWEASGASASASAKRAAAAGKAVKVELETTLSEKMPSKAKQAAVITGPVKNSGSGAAAGKGANANGVRRTGKVKKEESEEEQGDDDDDDDDEPLVAVTAPRSRAASGRAAAGLASRKLKDEDSDVDDDEDEEEPLAASQSKKKDAAAAKAKAKPKSKAKAKEDEEEEGDSEELSEVADDDDDDDDDDVPLGKKR
ncbi:DNA topoisomerase 1 [Tilletia horrida]|nr:DNA topoisomerase 1 [Tilletia horrida]